MGRRIARGWLAAGTVALFVALGSPVSATAAESVRDGGFEATNCPTDAYSCVNPQWQEHGALAFLCEIGHCFSGPASGSRWLTLGADYPSQFHGIASDYGALTQMVSLPPGPKALRFKLKTTPSTGEMPSNFGVQVAGNTVYEVGPSAAPDYTLVSVDIGEFASPDPLELRFYTACFDPFSARQKCARYDVDDVSLIVADAPGAPPADGDGDGAPDASDNCPQHANGEQGDADSDGIGDACEPPKDVGEGVGLTAACDDRTATLIGTEKEEILRGSAKADVIVGLGGDDVVRAGRGDDVVCAGDGEDALLGQGGTDALYGDAGNDDLSGGAGAKDRCHGGPGKDDAGRGCEKTPAI